MNCGIWGCMHLNLLQMASPQIPAPIIAMYILLLTTEHLFWMFLMSCQRQQVYLFTLTKRGKQQGRHLKFNHKIPIPTPIHKIPLFALSIFFFPGLCLIYNAQLYTSLNGGEEFHPNQHLYLARIPRPYGLEGIAFHSIAADVHDNDCGERAHHFPDQSKP